MNGCVFKNVCLAGLGLLRWMDGGINFLVVIWASWPSQAFGLPSCSLDHHSCMWTGHESSGRAITIPAS